MENAELNMEQNVEATETTVETNNNEVNAPTMTRDDVNRAVSKVYARKQREIDELKAQLSQKDNELLAYKDISDVLVLGGVEGTPAEQSAYLRSFYGMTAKQADDVVRANTTTKNGEDDDTLSFVKAERYAKKLNDEDVVYEFEEISKKPIKQRTTDDEAMIEVLGERYSRIKFNQNINEANSWFNKEYPDEDFKKLINSDDFIEFAQGNNQSLKEIIKKYQKYVGKKPKEITTGSVKDIGTSKVKDFYTKEEADKLSKKDLDNPQVMNAVMKSMTKWK